MPNYNYNTRKRIVHPLAPVSLGFGILAVILSFAFLIFLDVFIAFPMLFIIAMVLTALIAMITGRNAISRIKEAPETYRGKGMAIPGFIMGLVLMIIYTIIALLTILFILLVI